MKKHQVIKNKNGVITVEFESNCRASCQRFSARTPNTYVGLNPGWTPGGAVKVISFRVPSGIADSCDAKALESGLARSEWLESCVMKALQSKVKMKKVKR